VAFTVSFGKFWRAWQKSFTGDRGPAFAEASACGQRAAARGYAEGSSAFYDEAGNVIETHEHAGDFKEP
jgi:hypothetical protein